MVNQVGRPAMFEGNMFLPETGTPIWKMARIRTVLAVWLPRTIHGCDLDTKVVDYVSARRAGARLDRVIPRWLT